MQVPLFLNTCAHSSVPREKKTESDSILRLVNIPTKEGDTPKVLGNRQRQEMVVPLNTSETRGFLLPLNTKLIG